MNYIINILKNSKRYIQKSISYNRIFIKFISFGSLMELVSFTLVYLLIEIGIHYSIVLISLFIVLGSIRFIVYDKYVFTKEKKQSRFIYRYFQFIFFRLGFFIIYYIYFFIFFDLIGYNQGIVHISYLIIATILWYLINKYFVFR